MEKELKKYVVLNKEGLPSNRVKEETQVNIRGEGYKAGDTIDLCPDVMETKSLLGDGWLELVDKEKPKIKLDPTSKIKNIFKGKKKDDE